MWTTGTIRDSTLSTDLCAAPGGKATELGVRIGGEGLLVANEISSSRVRALKRNLELFGIRNAIVTNEPPHRLQERFLSFFDQVLVDAPCSGEGMFRKNPEAVATWSLEKVKECAAVQREILPLAADMLRPGGYLVYSTCTFEPEENELAIWHLLLRRPDMELVRIDCTQGRESFARAYSAGELAEKGIDKSLAEEKACELSVADMEEEKIEDIFKRRFISFDLSDIKARNRVQSYYLRRGFSFEKISKIVKKYRENDEISESL